ncbi:MAG: hypothetical protein HQK50_04655 [Oligoflexia bacterium]|nr:hypothetical protein [Oligoflexia bacterium]
MKLIIPLLLCLFTTTNITTAAPSASDPNKDLMPEIKWELLKEASEYKIFRGKTAHESGIYPLKMEATIAAPLPLVLTVLNDTERKPEWVPNMLTSATIKKVSEYEKIERGTYDAPWPVNDREFLVRITAELELQEGSNKGPAKIVGATAKISSVDLPDFPLPAKGLVRGQSYNGNVVLKSVDNDTKTYFQIIFFNDFKGSLPVFIVNFVQREWPENFISKLKSQLQKPNLSLSPLFL